MIFGVYGAIKKCDVIRDWMTGQSLQYAFIEYETKEACEEAYYKMDNALIDERRIKVDFSQSVGKRWMMTRRNPQKLSQMDAELQNQKFNPENKRNNGSFKAPGPQVSLKGDTKYSDSHKRHQLFEEDVQRDNGRRASTQHQQHSIAKNFEVKGPKTKKRHLSSGSRSSESLDTHKKHKKEKKKHNKHRERSSSNEAKRRDRDDLKHKKKHSRKDQRRTSVSSSDSRPPKDSSHKFKASEDQRKTHDKEKESRSKPGKRESGKELRRSRSKSNSNTKPGQKQVKRRKGSSSISSSED